LASQFPSSFPAVCAATVRTTRQRRTGRAPGGAPGGRHGPDLRLRRAPAAPPAPAGRWRAARPPHRLPAAARRWPLVLVRHSGSCHRRRPVRPNLVGVVRPGRGGGRARAH
jgi:hypothetical protein